MTAALDFAMLPPEVNSARMYSGAGSGPMLAAASAWNALAAELRSTALSYGKVLTALTGEEWHGPASAAMAASAMPYVAWMSTTAAQAEQTATQASRRGGRLRGHVCRHGAPGCRRGQSCPVVVAGRDERHGSKHRRDRGQRGAVRRDVGPRRGGDVRLCRLLGGRQPADFVHRARASRQRHRIDGPGRGRHRGCRHLGRHRAEHVVTPALGGAQRAAKPGDPRLRRIPD